MDEPNLLWSIPGLLCCNLLLGFHLLDRQNEDRNDSTARHDGNTLSLNGTASISSLTSGTCQQAPSEKLIRSVIMQGKKSELGKSHTPKELHSLWLWLWCANGLKLGRCQKKIRLRGVVEKICCNPACRDARNYHSWMNANSVIGKGKTQQQQNKQKGVKEATQMMKSSSLQCVKSQ